MGFLNKLFGRPDKSVLLASLQRELDLVNESARIIDSTVNPETFFSRLDFYMERLKFLADKQREGIRGIKIEGESFTEKYKTMSSHEEQTFHINKFIDRMWKDTTIKAEKLKTDKGKQNRYKKFVEELSKYEYRLPPECIEHYKGLYETAMQSGPTTETNIVAASKGTGKEVIRAQKSALQDFNFASWHISISFGKSSSQNYLKAVTLAKSAPKYHEQTDDGHILHQAFYSARPDEYLKFIMLYELVGGWKSSFVMINGELVDRKVVGKLNYCYGDKCRSKKKDFCYGASIATSNPFGCHRIQVSAFNNPWWSFYEQHGGRYILKKDAILAKINEAHNVFQYCPCFDYIQIIDTLNSLPLTVSSRQLEKIKEDSSISYNYMAKIK